MTLLGYGAKGLDEEGFLETHGRHPQSSLENKGGEVFQDYGFRRKSRTQGSGKYLKSCV